MAFSMIPIYTQTVGPGGAGNFGFSNIPQTYTDLVIEISGRTTATDTGNFTQIVTYLNKEGYPASTHSYTQLEGNGSAVYSGRESGTYIRLGYVPSALATSGTFGNIRAIIPNYTSSNFKQVISESASENNGTGSESAKNSQISGLYRSSSPISSLWIDCGRTLAQHSTVTIYGIKPS